MLRITGHILPGGGVRFDYTGGDDTDGFVFYFEIVGKYSLSRIHQEFRDIFRKANQTWIRPERNLWVVDLDDLRATVDNLKADWIRGRVDIEPEIGDYMEVLTNGAIYKTYILLRFVREETLMNQKSRIFLSHKGANLQLVSRFYDVLKELGFDPWLDREDVNAGDALHRVMLSGMQTSCAAVFFITPQFQDVSYLAHEIDLALNELNELTSRGDSFRIISLALADGTDKRGVIPDALRARVYKKPTSELDALRDILRALPIAVGPPVWRN